METIVFAELLFGNTLNLYVQIRGQNPPIEKQYANVAIGCDIYDIVVGKDAKMAVSMSDTTWKFTNCRLHLLNATVCLHY